MKGFHWASCAVKAIALTSVLGAGWAQAAGPDGDLPIASRQLPTTVKVSARTADVRLRDQQLVGKLVDQQGQPAAKATVRLMVQGKERGRVATDAQGQFAFAKVPGGVYTLVSRDTALTVRGWTPQAAPPSASDAVLLTNGPAVRGQTATYLDGSTGYYGHGPNAMGGPMVHGGRGVAGGTGVFGRIRPFVSNPIVIGAAVAGGVAIPAAVLDDDEDVVDAS